MAVELQMLAWSVVLGLVQIGLASSLMTYQRGIAWNASARDGEPKALTGVAARLERAQKNFLETFPLFAALVLAVVVADRSSADTILATQVYLGARIIYVPLYAAGVPYLRTVAFGFSVWALLTLLGALL